MQQPSSKLHSVSPVGSFATGGASQPLGTAEHKARLTKGWVSDRTRRHEGQDRRIEEWLYDDSPESLEWLAQQARNVTRQRFGHVIQMYAPLYISNECVDTCTYCGFSRLNRIERKTLTVEAVLREAAYLMTRGFRHLLLVAGEHPRAVSVDYLAAIAQRLKPQLASLSIEVAPLNEDGYRHLVAAGVDGVVVYQETYDRARYAAVHLAGPKRDYDARRLAPSLAAAAGMRHIGMGILVGLADPYADLVALIHHVQKMQKRYPATEFQVSLPRLRPCAGGLDKPVLVSDDDFARMIFVLRLALPEVGIVLSTRESPELRDGLMSLGITQMSAGSRTEPGGYLAPQAAEEQFAVEDHRSPAEVAAAIRAHNLEPIWKDWESLLAAGPVPTDYTSSGREGATKKCVLGPPAATSMLQGERS